MSHSQIMMSNSSPDGRSPVSGGQNFNNSFSTTKIQNLNYFDGINAVRED